VSRTAWIIFSVVTVGVLAGLVYLSSQASSEPDVSNVEKFSVLDASEASGNISDHVFGKADSDVVLVEYADYQCPSCASAFPRVQSIIEDYGDDIAVVMRNFAFQQPHGMAAASAAEAAGLQGKYKEMADLLYTNQPSWARLGAADRDAQFGKYAEKLELDVEKFNTDRGSNAVRQKINFDKALGNESGVDSTPYFFLNGEPVSHEVSSDLEAFKDLIEKAIDEQ
jgi:protein-disulfide isomerase